MTYGIEVSDSSGRVIIDSNYPHMVEVSSGSITPSEIMEGSLSQSNGKLRLGRISASGKYNDNIIFAIKIPEGKWIRIGRRSENGLGFGNKEINEMEFNTEDSSTTIQYKIFANTKYVSQSSDPYGLWIWDESGNLIFDSGLRTFNVIENSISNYGNESSSFFANVGDDWFIPGIFSTLVLYATGNPNIGRFGRTFVMMSNGALYTSVRSISLGPPHTGDSASVGFSGPSSITRIKVT